MPKTSKKSDHLGNFDILSRQNEVICMVGVKRMEAEKRGPVSGAKSTASLPYPLPLINPTNMR